MQAGKGAAFAAPVKDKWRKKDMKKVVIGMSGGVDSSAAAYLLKEKGYEVIGVTMKMWSCGHKTDDSAVRDAKSVCDTLGIEHHVLDFESAFKNTVVAQFIDEYFAGRTPNPCIMCNRYMKWEALLKYAESIGAKDIATGHYAQIVKLDNGRYTLRKSAAGKDQTYMLYRLTQNQLAHTLMPVGLYPKSKIREIASDIGLLVADKPDSQDICFLPDGNYQKFLAEYGNKKIVPGNFVTKEGRVLGQHTGITNYTIGQRKGLNLSMGHPVFVTEIRPETNEVVIGESEDLMTTIVKAKEVNWMAVEQPKEALRVTAKIRYAHKGSSATVTVTGEDTVTVVFDEPQRAATPGQSVVFYEDDMVIGGGTIYK